jgi:RNA-directed DNA polymerase
VISPVLLNIALHGMEQAVGVRYLASGWVRVDSPVAIRYADDFVVHCHSRQDALEIKARLAVWLAPRGLAFNEDKTRVVSLNEGFDFLGFNVRRYGTKPLIKPSKAAVRRLRERLRAELRSLRGTNAAAVIKRLNPIIRGWATYYRSGVSSKVFGLLDHYLWKLTYKWAIYSHSNKPTTWVSAQYFGKFNKSRQDRWVFGDRDSGAYLHRFAWTNIVRHQIVKHGASPDDPELAEYWARRRRKSTLPISKTSQWLLGAQHGRCAICRGSLLAIEDRPQLPQHWEHWLVAAQLTVTTTARRAVTPNEAEFRLIHAGCHHGNGPAPPPAKKPLRLA